MIWAFAIRSLELCETQWANIYMYSSKSAMARKPLSFSSQFLSSKVSTRFNKGTFPSLHHGYKTCLHEEVESRDWDLSTKVKAPQEANRFITFRLTRELEKKFSDRHVLFLAQRRILPRPKRSNRSRTTQTQKRPRSRTLTAVHDAILADVVYPVEIVGKRTRTREDGSKLLKVILDEKERGGVDYRLDTYGEVYRKLTGKGVAFEFPVSAQGEY